MATTEDSWGIHPVDSATRTCCGGIGNHTQECWREADARLQRNHAHVPVPDDADSVRDWDTDDEGPYRWIYCTHDGPQGVHIGGPQRPDGTIVRFIEIEAHSLTVPGLREYAAQLLGLADDLESRGGVRPNGLPVFSDAESAR